MIKGKQARSRRRQAMAIVMRSELHGVSADQIRPFVTQMNERMKSFPGFIAQVAGPIPGGYQVTEVWETQEAHERWVREVIAPAAAQQLGVTQAPSAQYLPLDFFITR
jgi:hypothetical protein